jgi:hypothetical protein
VYQVFGHPRSIAESRASAEAPGARSTYASSVIFPVKTAHGSPWRSAFDGSAASAVWSATIPASAIARARVPIRSAMRAAPTHAAGTASHNPGSQ